MAFGSDMNYRTSLEYPMPKALVKHLLNTAKAGSPEKRVWRDMLNGDSFNKFRDGVKLGAKKSKAEPEAPKAKGKKK